MTNTITIACCYRRIPLSIASLFCTLFAFYQLQSKISYDTYDRNSCVCVFACVNRMRQFYLIVIYYPSFGNRVFLKSYYAHVAFDYPSNHSILHTRFIYTSGLLTPEPFAIRDILVITQIQIKSKIYKK